MRFHQIFPVIAISGLCAILSLCAMGSAFANPTSGGGGEPAAVAAPVGKASLDTSEAPIVSGRSASAHHRSKMHHVHLNLDQLGGAPLADETAPAGE
jgi:hypothetical protein